NTMLWRDWLYPFPMEGAAVVVIGLVLYPFFTWLKKKVPGKRRWLAYVISFFAGALLCTIIEGGMGLIVNADLQLWDYRENFAHIGGQECLQNTMAFGVVAASITWWVYPMLERMIARVPRDIMNIVAVVIFVFGAIVWSLYLINPPGVDGQGADPTEIVQQQVEEQKIAARGELGDVADAIGATNDALREAVGKSLALGDDEKARILAEIDDISESVKAIEGELAADGSAGASSAAAAA
ncbi:MAG: putative ABC transporter permease, partial [Eggerthellaceae bacterium]|nr:putative ABC transporter permease [Eggerthellaceae bacterium]